tara:strand:- start:383 stop:607 length:225 start_codon:yes stop_codon:yes gene_type:complete
MKINLIKIINNKYPKLKKKKINKKTDLIDDLVFDSLELVSFLSFLEKKYKFSIKKYTKKNKNFVVEFIENQLNN